MKRTIPIMLLVACGCAGRAPSAAEPAAEETGEQTDQPPLAGKKVWEEIPDAPHGQCCTSDDECGGITCEPYEYAHQSCEKVCTYSCEPGDLCPAMGGTLDPPGPCPESGLCPVGMPFA